jgi:beta-phosphoglucomutase
MRKIEAIIFDMDGVLVDSEPVIEAAAMAGLKEFGVTAQPEDFIPFVGAGEDNYIGGVSRKYGVPFKREMKDRVYQIYLDLVENRIGLYKGIPELLGSLKKQGYALALASSADHIKIEANLKAAGISRDLFDILLGGEDVVNKKPDPEIYLAASRGLKKDPENCLVMEDALNGIEAGKAAGCLCCGVSTSFLKKELVEKGADFVVEETVQLLSLIDEI